MQDRLRHLFGARTVALIGASQRPRSVGAVALDQLIDGGFTGEVFPVNPRYDRLRGRHCYASLTEVPTAVDLAILAVPDASLVQQLELAAATGVRATVIFGGFSAVGDMNGAAPADATSLSDRLGRIAAEAGMVLCGPNGMGFVDLDHRLWACGYTEPADRRPGSITLISHSGSVFSALLHNDRGLEFNLAISAGQEAVVTAADYLMHALERESTRVVALFLETVRDAEGFRAGLARAMDRDVPVVALKVGRSTKASELVRAHSGGLAGDDGAYDGLFDAYGVTRVRSLDEMADTLELFAAGRRAGQGGVAALHDSGGERAHFADVAADEGVPFAAISEPTRSRLAEHLDIGMTASNPLDAWGSGRDFEAAFHNHAMALHDDPDTSVVALALDLTTEDDPDGGYVAMARRVMAETTKPVALIANLSSGIDRRDALALRASGVPVLEGTRTGLAAVRHLLRRRDAMARPQVADLPRPPAHVRDRWRHRLGSGAALDEAEALELLDAYGIATVARQVVTDEASALAAAERLGWPVALKTAMPSIEHKTDVGGVHLNLAGTDQVRAAYRDLAARLGPRVLVAEMAASGPELILGMVHDPQLGALIIVAAGGVFTELLHDREVALPPLDGTRARELIDRLQLRQVLDGTRGRQPCDVDAIVTTIVRFAVLVDELGDLLAAMDVNPLLAGPTSCTAVDALVILSPDPGPAAPGYLAAGEGVVQGCDLS